MALFALQPMAFGAWLALIPYIKDTLSLEKADLALALLGMPVALIAVLQVASRIVARIGIRRTFIYLFPLQTLAVLLPFFATGQTSLFFALASLGAIVAFMEVALNTYAGRLEKEADVMIMSRCHGFWALGVTAGSFMVTMLFGLGPLVAVLAVCAVSAGVGIFAAMNLPKLAGQEDGPAPKPQKLRDMPRILFIIAAFMFLVTMVEGAMTDWAAVYLSERQGGAPEDAGIAVTVFAGFLAAGRFVGDYMKARLGARGVARLTVGLAIAGLGLATIPEGPVFLFAGFALSGLGVSIAFPLGVSAAAGLDDQHEAQNIATIAMIAMSSFLIGPPLIGFLAEWLTLRTALMLLVPGLGVAWILAGTLPAKRS
ncbi:MFS transporter [Pseudooctadecabacter jejudonensis]|nr:MFS transporter [Pseudooctadecabacter jejudonensis]